MNSRVRNLSEEAWPDVHSLSSSRALSFLNSDLNSSVQTVASLLGVPAESLQELPAGERLRLTHTLGERTLQELLSLASETDRELFEEGLLAFGIRQEQGGNLELAGQAYGAVADFSRGAAESTGQGSVPSASVPDRAQARLDILAGTSSFGQRFELLARNFSHQASDPAMLLGMAAAGAFFQTARLATMSRLLASPTASFWTRGIGAEAIAWGTGSLLELPAFTFATRGAQEALGRHQDWSQTALGRDLLANGLTLFALKAAGAGGSAAMRRLQTAEGMSNAFVRFSAAAVPQLASFAGLLGAHVLEVQFGLRRPSDPASAIFDSLATLLQFHVSGNLLRGLGTSTLETRLAEYHLRLTDPSTGLGRRNLFSAPWLSTGSLEPLPASGIQSVPEEPDSRPLAIPMMSEITGKTDGRTLGNPAVNSGSATLKPVPLPIEPQLLQAINDHFKRCGGNIYTLHGESPPEAMWAHQSYLATVELHGFTGDLHGFLPEPQRPPELLQIRDELRWIHRMLYHLRQEDGLPDAAAPEVKAFLASLYLISNKMVNYIDSSERSDIRSTLRHAKEARQTLLHSIFRLYQINPDAWVDVPDPSGELLRRARIDPESPTRELLVPTYDYYPQLTSEYFDIHGQDRKVALLGDIPLARLVLSQRHFVEAYAFDFEQRSRLAGEVMERGNLTRFRLIRSERSAPKEPVDYLEAYDFAFREQLEGKAGEQLLQQQILDRLRDGGIAHLVSQDAQVMERMVQILTQNGSAGILMGAYRSPLRVKTHRPDANQSNFVFIRKLPSVSEP